MYSDIDIERYIELSVSTTWIYSSTDNESYVIGDVDLFNP